MEGGPAANDDSATDLKGTDFITRSIAFVLDDAWAILKAATPWMIPLLLVDLWPIVNPEGFAGRVAAALLNLQATGRWAAGPTFLQWMFVLASSVLRMVVIAGFAASQHRRVLRSVVPFGRTLSEAVAPYVLYWLLAGLAIGVLWFLYVFVLGLVGAALLPRWSFWLLILAGAVLMGLIAMRAILVFPAIAVGDRAMTVERSFNLTRKSVWRMMLAVFLLIVILVVIFFALGLALGFVLIVLPPTIILAVSTVLQTVAEFFSTAVFVTYVSLAYARLAHGAEPRPAHW